MNTRCELCPRHCELEEDAVGFCRARVNYRGFIRPAFYGKISSIALEPVEKKPLREFFPGSSILSVGGFGCNLCCPFCHNSEVSHEFYHTIGAMEIPPAELATYAFGLRANKNIGVAYTYNEPLVGYEYVMDCAAEVRKRGMKNVVVTNGSICEEPFIELLHLIDAMNIDLKGFTQEMYDFVGGNLETVKRSIELAANACHVEVTTLIIPGKNDCDEEMDRLSGWLSTVSEDIPLHISRFFPRYKMAGAEPTPIKTIERLTAVASRNLKRVYMGNC